MSETIPSIDVNKILVTVKPNDHATHDDPTSESLSPIENSSFRKIEFRLAKKPSAAFDNETGDSSFRLELLNPTTTNLNNNDAHDDQHGVVFDGVSDRVTDKPSVMKSNASELSPENINDGVVFDGVSDRVTDKPSVMKRNASELSPDNNFAIDLRRIGAGLENLGNTCFLNSVLQCLTYTVPLVAYLQSGKHQISCRNAGFCTLCAIQKHVSCALKSSGKSLVPLELVLNLRYISRTFQIFRQEDAHEYMVNLLESMHKCCLPSGVATESPSAYENSLVHKIFGGHLRSQVKCMQCTYCSNKFEPFIDLSLEILKVKTIYKALEDFTAEEQLDGYDCQDCKEKVKALKQFTIHEAPNVLTIHLKRFCSFMSGLKINKKVHFDPTLNLKPFVSGPYDGDLEYTLYGVLVHAGWSTHSGHYYCFVRTSSGMWFLLNDDQVVQVSENVVLEQKAYILFYFHERKNHPSKKAADIIDLKERVMNTMGRNSTCPIRNMGNTNGTTETSAQNDSSESYVETLPVLVQKDIVNVPLVLHAPPVVNISDPKGQDIEDTLKVDNTMNEPTISSISDEKGQDIEDTMKVGSAMNEQTIHNIPDEKGQDTDDAMKVDSTMNEPTKSNMSDEKGNVATVPSISDGLEKHSPMNDKKEALSTIFTEHEEKCTCEDLSDSIAVKISNKPEMAIRESACGFSWEITSGGLLGADSSGGGDESQKAVDISTENLCVQKIETFLIDKNVHVQESRKNTKNHLKVKATSIKYCSNSHMGRMLNRRNKKKHKRNRRSNFPAENLHLKGNMSGSNNEDRTDNLLVNNIENEFKERIYEGGAMIGTFIDRHSNGDLGANSLEATELGSSKSFTGLQCKDQSICSMQVFEDRTVVPLWHENESTSSQIKETEDIPSIGFIGDKWDEDYDRGKSKKARAGSSTKFDRRNGFQDLANGRLNCHAGKPKKPRKKRSKKFHKSSSGNRRFRR